MNRQRTPNTKGKSAVGNGGGQGQSTNGSWPAASSPYRRTGSIPRIRNEGSIASGNRNVGSRLNPIPQQIIMTKAQLRRKNGISYNPTNTPRTVLPAQTDNGPTTVARLPTASGVISSNTTNSIATRQSSKAGNGNPASTNSTRPSPINQSVISARIGRTDRSGHNTPLDTLAANEITRATPTTLPPHNRVLVDPGTTSGRGTTDSHTIDQPRTRNGMSSISFYKPKKFRNRVTFDLPESEGKDSVSKVLSSEKILPRILGLMNWNELLPLRTVCKAWFEIIESHPGVKSILGILVLRPEIESKMLVFNSSSVTWTKFRFIGPVIFDMTKSVQHEFWSKHGPLMLHLEINNRAMTLTGLVEILARCPKLEFFKCNWTPEMYSFNSELIKKYYGIHFNNGTFAHLKDLVIEYSSSLTDSALWSILKWCGGSLRSLKLTSPPDEDVLTRLKPRWSVESIKNYFERFGYTGNLQYLDFSWSNLTAEDVRNLASIDMSLKGITLNYCRLDDNALRKLLLRHGETLEVFKIEGVPFSETLFNKEILPKVKVLHIGGVKGMVQSLSFLADMPHLQELSCHKTQWLEHNMILRPLNSKSREGCITSLDFGGGIKHSGNKKLDPNLSKTWFSDFTGLISNIRELNLSQWSLFGTDVNFRNICQTLFLLEKLVVRDWEQLGDIGVTGLYEEEIHQDWGTRVPQRSRVFIGLLKRLKVLDLSGTAVTDASVTLALYALRNLRTLAIDGTRITDSGLRALIKKLPTLDRISIIKCPNISVSQPRITRPDGRKVFTGKL